VTTARQQGDRWERYAESFLRRRGLRSVARNFNTRFGEIDLVMLDGAVLVFVEVRYRRRNHYGSGADSVTWAKQRRLISAARHFLTRHRRHAGRACRFDVVSLGGGADGPPLDPEVNWIQHAFEAD
jgi:putative endonuclease